MPERHYREYAAYYREQPFGLWREDFRFAYLLAAVARMLGGKDQTPGAFMPFHQPAAKHDDSQKAIDEAFASVVTIRA